VLLFNTFKDTSGALFIPFDFTLISLFRVLLDFILIRWHQGKVFNPVAGHVLEAF